MKLAPLHFDDALYVAQRMRQADRDEIYATRWNEDPRDVATDCMRAGPFAWVAGLDTPIAVVGAAPMHPGSWNVFMFATDNFPNIQFSLTKFVKRVMIPALVQSGAHRAECRSLESHEVAHRWLELLGARRKDVLENYGRNRETFFYYVWDDPDAALRPPRAHRA